MTTTEMTKQKESPMETVKGLLQKHKNQIALALPRHLDADRMVRVATTAAAKTPALLDCHPVTLLGAVIQAAQLGLEPNDGTGQAWLIPFNNRKKDRKEVQFIPGYRGLISLARRSKEITRFEARVVLSDDRAFDFEYGLEPRLVHKPGPGVGKPTHFYAVAKFTNGDVQFEVMTKEEVDKIRKRSKASGAGPWVTDYNEMGKKTVTRRLSKYLPTSVELQKAVNLDEAAERGAPQDLGTLIDPNEIGTVAPLEEGDVPDPKSGAIDAETEPTNPEADETNDRKQVTIEVTKTTSTTEVVDGKEVSLFKIYAKDKKKGIFVTLLESIKNAAENAKKDGRKVKVSYDDTDLGQQIELIEAA